MPRYSYDPTKITEGGVDQMRFELGDTVTEGEGISSPMCDEEYEAIIKKYAGESWRKARYLCLRAIVMKLSYEVNTSVGGLSYSGDRYKRWKELLDEEKRAMSGIYGVPVAGNPQSLSPHGGTPYFYNDMQANRRKF